MIIFLLELPDKCMLVYILNLLIFLKEYKYHLKWVKITFINLIGYKLER